MLTLHVAMIKHSLDVISKAVEHLNPGQTPVVTFDQPLYLGQRHLRGTMNPSGHAYPKQASPVMNLSLANVRRVVLVIASAKKPSYSAQASASVKASANSLPCDINHRFGIT